MTRRILSGMQKAALVFHTTSGVREEILRHGLADAARLVHVPLGVSAEYTADPSRGELSLESQPPLDAVDISEPFLLHVGSCIPRKRIDVLLDVFAAVRKGRPELRLVQVGGDFTETQREQLRQLGLVGHVRQVRGLTREQVAMLYRSALLLLQTSDAEGFGLPVIEGLACGGTVVASDLPVLREVGGPAGVYCEVGNTRAWAETVGRLIDEPGSAPSREARLAWASRYTWRSHAKTIADAYGRLPG